jgi:glycosyltransferase involved in cell wall biosynthesis
VNIKEKKPKVSVCVVTYNQEKYIRQCLQSIVDQETNFDFEVIVGDDCSTDGTSEIVREFARNYPTTVKPIFHKKNIGAVKNYLDTHNAAAGEFIAHMDGDDFWLPDKLESQINFLKAHQECSAVYANAVVVTELQKPIGSFNGKLPEVFDTGYLLEKGNFLNHSSFVYRSSMREKILDFKENFIDYQVHLRCSLQGNLGYINKILVGYRRTSNGFASASSVMVRDSYWEALAEIYRIDKKTPELKSAISDFMASIICTSLRSGNFKEIFAWRKIARKDAESASNQVLIFGLIKAIKKIFIRAKNNLLSWKNKSIIFSPR